MKTKDTTISKIAKIVFVACLIIFLFKEKSLEAVNIIRDLILKNLLIVIVFVIIILIWKTNQGGKTNG